MWAFLGRCAEAAVMAAITTTIAIVIAKTLEKETDKGDL